MRSTLGIHLTGFAMLRNRYTVDGLNKSQHSWPQTNAKKAALSIQNRYAVSRQSLLFKPSPRNKAPFRLIGTDKRKKTLFLCPIEAKTNPDCQAQTKDKAAFLKRPYLAKKARRSARSIRISQASACSGLTHPINPNQSPKPINPSTANHPVKHPNKAVNPPRPCPMSGPKAAWVPIRHTNLFHPLTPISCFQMLTLK